MNLTRVDLNLLVYLDVLLRERSVTKAAEQLGITQPAMSNGLKRLRSLFNDPLLVRTSEGMSPTERALALQPQIADALKLLEQAVLPRDAFNPGESSRVFRVMASDYSESTLVPMVLKRLRAEAPGITLDILTPSDVTFHDVEHGRVDMAINRFSNMPQSFHQSLIWEDSFSCVLSRGNPLIHHFTLESYLSAQHIWASKTGMGVGVGIDPKDVQQLGWVDEALSAIGHKRDIRVLTRHYQVAMLLSSQNDLIATLPSKLAELHRHEEDLVVLPPPFEIPPIQLRMAWSPLLHHDAGHNWLRQIIKATTQQTCPAAELV
ncbi:LysR family transcriptional regulator [Endozoicomonas sp. 4G]|uniref:LysR family transcriptional regulator n=1 Tax=Endozoicomonas sp. 4G TaxID=2872754 RepID=UPI0020789FC5|nr:LysR family transcriptional regulator [Endozoicomonas sp. 4G]